jgi:hypothetical protein
VNVQGENYLLIANNNDYSHKRSENVSFRLNKDIPDKLKIDAEQKQISLNTLANQVLDFYVNFAGSASADMMPSPKVALTDLVEAYEMRIR